MFDGFKSWNQKRFSNKMDKWYLERKEKWGDAMQYDPLLSVINFGENQLQEYIDRLNENFAWSKSDPASLFKLYSRYRSTNGLPARRGTSKTGIERTVESNWWYAKLFIDNEEGVENAVRYSTGVAAKIPSTMASLCMGNGYNYSIQLANGDEDENSQAYKDLDYLAIENNLYAQLFKGFRTQSWAGGFAFKWSIHPEFDTPILEVYSPMNYHYKAIAGRIVEDIFTKFFYREEFNYKLEERYGVDSEGSYITYQLYKSDNLNKNNSWEPCNLSELSDTMNLKDIHLKGYFKKLSKYVPNKAINSQFPDSLYGESDFTGSYGALNFLDEAYSTWSQELRDGRLVKYMPDTMGEFDSAGDGLYPSFLRSTHLIVKGGIGQDADDKIEYRQGDLDSEKSENAIKRNYMIVLNNAGLSPLTFGLTGLEALDATAQSQQEKEKVSIRTRNVKNKIQEPAISEMLSVGYDLYQIFKSLVQSKDGVLSTNIKPSTVTFKFNDYIIKSKEDRVRETSMGLTSGVYDLATAIDYVHEDLSDDEKLTLKINSKIEKGMSLTPKEAEYFNIVNEVKVDEEIEQEVEKEEPIEEDLDEDEIDELEE